ncbi:putative 2-dehydropantoate 2-reductase [Trichocoleus sp. FACHB-591]|uniref:putative 2-dehydropantoate 2-reductase n=1 Tax=Trichocoleus sp. FACHB-591 TaxID=2692872 RepID=UPI001688582B|nr:putative 2-dehydropantoate 2-reductase [Trichocoleus sp. FACHB-591]MBD2098117.1 putative 2-dehydropantoate 2-reductase [Trichocoleus sp. FACHB-591]
MGASLGAASNRRYAILGTGALGGFYGARLQQAGTEVHFLLRSDYEQVQQQGLVIESPEGNFTLSQVYAYRRVEEMPRCDVVVVALKSTHNHLLPALLPRVLKEDGVVLVLQNGLGLEAEVAQIVGAKRVMGGLCFICSNKVGPGHIRHLDYGAITLGEYAANYQAGGITERMSQIAQDFTQAGIPIHLAEDLLLARWHKLVWNIPFNGLSVVLNATTDALMADRYTYALAEQLMREVALGAKVQSRAIADDFIQKMLDDTVKMKPYRTSMKIDYDEGRSLEVEAIFGNPLRAAQAAGVQLPQIAMLYQQLKFLSNRTRAQSPEQG